MQHLSDCQLQPLFLYLMTIVRGKIKTVFQPIIENHDGGIKFAIAGTIFGPTFGVLLSLFTVSLIEPAIAQTIFSLVPVFALFVARILTKRKNNMAVSIWSNDCNVWSYYSFNLAG